MTECQSCPRDINDERNLCRICERRVIGYLEAIPKIYRALENLVGTKPTGSGKSAAVEAPAPCNIDALNLTAVGGIPDILTSWAEDWYDLLDWSPPEWTGTLADCVTSAVHRLRVNLPWAAEQHPAAGDFVCEIARLHSRAHRVIDGDPPRVPLGACACGGHITANPAALVARCSHCAEEWRGADLVALAESLRCATPSGVAA
ncbi:hypothetical protein [Streptomyces iranensis]|uniref:hypothetical protein n=1 Tax=Streptomyces iranensis TaxID=576784 RepID=UPI0039B75A34